MSVIRIFLFLCIVLICCNCKSIKEPFEGVLTYVYTNDTKTMDKPDTVKVYLKDGNCRIKEIVNDRLFIMDVNGTYLINEENKKFFAYYNNDCYDSVFFVSLNKKRNKLYKDNLLNETKTILNLKCNKIAFLDSLDRLNNSLYVPFWEYQIWVNSSFNIKKHPVAEHSEIDEVELLMEQNYLPTLIKKTYRGDVKYGKLIVSYRLIKIDKCKLDNELFNIPNGYKQVGSKEDLY